jgi:curved DNA-binding protein
MQFRDYYETLGVPRTTSEDEIKSAFRKMARKYHPDVAKDKKGAEDRFKEVNEAYEVLGDPSSRRKYDQLGEKWNQPGGYGQPTDDPTRVAQARGFRRGAGAENFDFSGTGFSDFFEAFFGARQSGGSNHFSHFPEEEVGHDSALDIEGDLVITYEEALHGGSRTISLRRTDALTGHAGTDTFHVKIPAGIREGQRIRLTGQGESGQAYGEKGDLYLRVRYAKHPDFRLEGPDLYYDLPIAPWEAVLGANVTMPTLEGSVSLKIQPASESGQKLRLRGLGMPKAGKERGDLYAVLSIQVPTEINSEERLLWEQLAKKSHYRARG